MARILDDLVDYRELTEYVRNYNREILDARFSLTSVFPEVTVEDLEFQVRRGQLQDVETAEFRPFDTPAPFTGRQGTTISTFSLPPVSRQTSVSEEEALRLRMLDRGTNDPLIDDIYNDSERMIRSVAARLELARGDVLVDGVLTIAENGLSLTVDYGMPANHKITVATAWTVANAATATPLTDLLDAVQTYIDTNGEPPGRIIMSETRLPGLRLNQELRDYAASNGTTPQRVGLQTINDIFTSEGIPPIEFYDTQVRVAGVRTRVLPADRVLLLPSDVSDLGRTYFGVTAEAVTLIERNLIDRAQGPGLLALVMQNEHPVQTFTLGTAIALPVVPNAELLMTLDVE